MENTSKRKLKFIPLKQWRMETAALLGVSPCSLYYMRKIGTIKWPKVRAKFGTKKGRGREQVALLPLPKIPAHKRYEHA